jgi:DUF971 family protein
MSADFVCEEQEKMPAAEQFRPLALKKEGDERLVIEWNDGHRSVYAWQYLRSNCPCATCREERQKPVNPFRILSNAEVAAGPLRPVALTPQGRYAYKITWNDGHDTGIYSLEALRSWCQCEQCREKESGIGNQESEKTA